MDAQAVARVMLRDPSQLPAVVVEDEAAMLDIMTRGGTGAIASDGWNNGKVG